MKPLYQTEWLGIQFREFVKMSSTTVAGPDFYDAFYYAVFEKFANYESLPADWRHSKDEIADWLEARIPDGARVLSVGCGLGYMEQRLYQRNSKRIDLHVSDYSSKSLSWLKQLMPTENIHDVQGWAGLKDFDFIYLSGVDYAMTNVDFISFLSQLIYSLRPNGKIMLISASLLEQSALRRQVNFAKQVAKLILIKLGVRSSEKGQLWGVARSRAEYRVVMRLAGLVRVTDNFLITPRQSTYWIEGFGVN